MRFNQDVIERAAKLIEERALVKDSEKPIQTIAQDLGYAHLSYFRADFKERFNTTPKKFLLKHKIKQIKRMLLDFNTPLDDIYQRANYDSLNSLTGFFKTHTKMTPKEYRRRHQLKRARGFLRKNDLSINDVAKQSGFSEPNSFTMSFTRSMNQTPSEYRKQNSPRKHNAKIDSIKEQLLDFKTPMAKIVSELGYKSYPIFSDYFQYHTGITAKRFREEKKFERIKYLLTKTDLSSLTISQEVGFENVEQLNFEFQKNLNQTLEEYRVKNMKFQLLDFKKPIEDILKETGYESLSAFNSFFKMHEGISPRNFRRAAQISTAKALLEKNSLSLDKIKTHVGFETYRYFYSRFKTSVGHSPSEYRNNYINNILHRAQKIIDKLGTNTTIRLTNDNEVPEPKVTPCIKNKDKIDWVKDIIEQTNLSFTEIAKITGFNDFNHLSSTFPIHCFMSLEEYRQENLEQRIEWAKGIIAGDLALAYDPEKEKQAYLEKNLSKAKEAMVITNNHIHDIAIKYEFSSVSHLYNSLKENYEKAQQMGIGNYRNHLKTWRAQRYLRRTGKDADFIAGALGFEKTETFNAFFKEHADKSPEQYRKENALEHKPPTSHPVQKVA